MEITSKQELSEKYHIILFQLILPIVIIVLGKSQKVTNFLEK